MKIALLVITVAAICFSGCAGSPASIVMKSPAELTAQNDLELARAYGTIRNAQVRAELERRKLFTLQEWQLIETKSVGIGMSEAALLAAKGLPVGYGGMRTTVTAQGERKEYLFRMTEFHRPLLVTLENGKVSAYQN
jgi:hypothetical protein